MFSRTLANDCLALPIIRAESLDNETRLKPSPIRWRQWSALSDTQLPLVAAADVENDDSPWGFSASDTVGDDLEDEDDRKDAREDLSGGRYKFDLARFETILATEQAAADS